MRSGTWVVFLYAAFAAAVFALFRVYGFRVMAERPPDTPVTAVQAFVAADNTVVGLLGGIREVRPIEIRALAPRDRVGVQAAVAGARDRGTLYADVELVANRWEVARATFVLADGRRLPLRGAGRPALEPQAPGRP